MKKLSVAIICQDEEEVLPLTLGCLLPLSDIIAEVAVVDAFSRDATLAILDDHKKLGLPIICAQHDFDNFKNQKNRALGMCSGEWVLGLDADMMITSIPLRLMLLDGFFDARIVWDFKLIYARGDLKHYCVSSSTGMPTTRLWKNIGLRYERDIHEYLVLPGQSGWESIHNPFVQMSTEQICIIETSMLKSDSGLRQRAERYTRWAEASNEAGIAITNMRKQTEALIANRWEGTAETPARILEGLPENMRP